MTRRRQVPRTTTKRSAPPTAARSAAWWARRAAALLALVVLLGGVLVVRRLSDEPGLPPLGLLGLEPPLPRPGGRIATVWQRVVWAVDAASGNPQRLATIPAGRVADQVAWAPDASRLAVSQVAYTATESLGIGGLYLLPVTGGEATTLLMEGTAGTRFEEPSWTPDGGSLVYFYSRFPGSGGGAVNRIERVSLADGQRTVLVDDAYAPGLSADGQSLAFVRRGGRGESLWLAEGSPDAARELVPERRFLSIGYPRFSPDGSRLAFAATDWPSGGRPPDTVAEQREPAGRAEPDTALSSAGAVAVSFHLPGVHALELPAGGRGRAARTASRPSAHGSPWDLWVMQRDGSGLRRLTRLAVDDASLAWSPDGAWLALQGTGGLYLVHYDSGRVVRLTDRTEAVGIDWTP